MHRHASWLVAVGLATALLGVPAHAGEPTTDPVDPVDPAELEALKDALSDDAAEEEAAAAPAPSAVGAVLQAMNPRIALIMDVALAYFDQEPLQVGAHDPNKSGFTLQQLELHMDASVDPYFRLDANIVFAQFGVEVEEVYATTLALPAGLQVRAGQFLTRFGRLNASHPHSWSFADQPLVNGKFFGGEGSRGLGIELSWLAPTSWYLELVASATEAGGACCARSFYGANDLGVDGPEDFVYTLALKQFFPFDDDWSLSWGLSAQLGPNPTGQDNRTEIYGSDLYLRYRPVDSRQRSAWSLQVEGMFRTRQVPNDVLQDWGLYAQTVWNITPEWELGARYEYVRGVVNDPLDTDWDADRQRASVQVTFHPSHFSRIRLQGAHDAPGYRPDPIWGAMLAFEVLIGAHGAHRF